MLTYHVGFVTIYISELNRSLEFYLQVLGLTLLFKDESHGVALLANSGATLILQQVDGSKEQRGWLAHNTGISLTVEDLEARINILETRGVRFLSAPQRMFWGKSTVPFLDPDNNRLALVG